jgi:hypothetical protein
VCHERVHCRLHANCIQDEGGPLEDGLQGQSSNHLELQRSRACVVSVEEKPRRDRGRWDPGRRTQVNRRGRVVNSTSSVETGREGWPGMKPSGCLLTGWVALGIKAA